MAKLLDVIRKLVGEVHPKWKNLHFTPDTQLERELGLDSMARMELRTRIEKELGVGIDEAVAIAASTPNALMLAITASNGQLDEARTGGSASELLMGDFGGEDTLQAGPKTPAAGEWIYAVYAWSVFLALGLASWVVIILTPGARLRRTLAHYCARIFLFLSFTPLKVSGLEHIHRDRPVILVANHASYIDGFIATAAIDIPFHFIVKGELAANLPVRLLLERFGVEFVDRFNASKGHSDVSRIADKSRGGDSILFFPEGTFTSFAGLQPFRMGAFVTAARTDSPLIPVAISGTRNIVRGDDWFPRRGSIRVSIQPPVFPRDSSWNAALELRNAARHAIRPYIGEPDLVEGEDD